MRTKDETKDAVASVLREIRSEAGLSKAKMAAVLNVDERTLKRYEDGDSAPSVPEFLNMLENVGVPALPVLLRYLYPDTYSELAPGANVQDLRKGVVNLIENDLTDRDTRQIAYIMTGPHGSPLSAQLQLFTAIDHLPMDSRLMVAKLVLNTLEIELARGKIINPEYVMPDIELLREAIIKATLAVVEGRNSYSNIVK